MPTTRKKVIKTVYKDENNSEPEESGDFSDSGSDAKISGLSSSEDDEPAVSSGEEFEEEDPKPSKAKKPVHRKKGQFAKNFIKKIRQDSQEGLDERSPFTQAFSVKDLTDADKLLPSFLNLSESDSSEDESPRKPSVSANATFSSANDPNSDVETKMDYQDVWSNNMPDNSEEIARKTFKELEIHKSRVDETKASILNYTAKTSKEAFDVKDLLAQGEELLPEPELIVKKSKKKKKQNDSDSEMEDWEEVKEVKALPASGLQVVVDFPDVVQRKSKKVDVEMMMRRKMNRVKKEYQVYMHKVHVLCWLGHGNYVSSVLNDQEIMSAVLSLVPSKECYPGERVDVKYVEQITKWFKNKLTLKQDKHENKFKPKAPPLKDIMLKDIKSKVVSTKKYMFFIFVSMLRALGLQCRVMFNFVTLPIRPPSSELCSLSTKTKDGQNNVEPKKEETKKSTQKKRSCKKNTKQSIPQVDGNYDGDTMHVEEDYYSDSNIMQVDGQDDGNVAGQKDRKTRLTRRAQPIEKKDMDNEDVSPPKRAKVSPPAEPQKPASKIEVAEKSKPKKRNQKKASEEKSTDSKVTEKIVHSNSNVSPTPKSLSLNRRGKAIQTKTEVKTENICENSPSKPKPRSTRNTVKNDASKSSQDSKNKSSAATKNPPEIIVTNEKNKTVSSTFFEGDVKVKAATSTRRRSRTTDLEQNAKTSGDQDAPKSRSKSACNLQKSKYFNASEKTATSATKQTKKSVKDPEDELRTSHRDIMAKTETSPKNDLASTLIEIMKKRMDECDTSSVVTKKAKAVKGKSKNKGKDDSDYEPGNAMADDDFKPTKISPKPSTSRKIDRRVLSTEDETPRDNPEDELRVSHRDIMAKTETSPKNDLASTLIEIMKKRMDECDTSNVVKKKAKAVKGKSKNKGKGDSDYEPGDAMRDDDFKPTKISPKPSSSRKIDHQVLSTDDETPKANPEDELRVSHRDIMAKTKTSPKNDMASTLIEIMKKRMDEYDTSNVVKKKAKAVKGKSKNKGKDDSDYEPGNAMADDDFKPTKISPKPSTSRKIDRRVLSTDDETPRDKTDVWCEVFVEELEQWIAVDVVKGQVHCTNEIYGRATHPVCYVVGWDNNNYLKDLTRRYVPHWNTVTRKQRAESAWWEQAIAPWKGPRTAKDREEDEALDRMQLDAPLPKSIAEYKNHPLYALQRHLLKYEALYPPDAATLGFVRNEAVYARECVYVCRSRDTWLKEAKVVKLGEKPYKIVKARPKWDKLSNKLITDKPLEIFGPWQVQDYEPPVAENGVVPRNAYGNVELFKDCMLPKGTVHIKLPGLNKVAKKLNIDCAPAMTGFDFNGGWSHPVYDGFVVCQEFEEVVTQAWLEDQEEMERRDREKTETRVYGNWKRLIKGLMIRERLKLKYGFEEPSTSYQTNKPKGPRFATKKKT